ncbi:MAG: hypothetical protein ACE5D6_04635, partial [Candidatus Zixiibacteriota bacterium]
TAQKRNPGFTSVTFEYNIFRNGELESEIRLFSDRKNKDYSSFKALESDILELEDDFDVLEDE